MSNLIMVRHGRSEYNAKITSSLDSSLTEDGRLQIRRAGRSLYESIYNDKFIGHSSPYLRTLQTAEIISEETGVAFKVVMGPRETMTIYDHCKINDHRGRFPQFDWTGLPDIQNGLEVFRESDQEYLDRIELYVQEIADQDIIVVSHGIPVVTMMEMRMGVRRIPSMYHYVSNGSITHLTCGRLVRYNHTPISPMSK